MLGLHIGSDSATADTPRTGFQMFTQQYITANFHLFHYTPRITIPALKTFFDARVGDTRISQFLCVLNADRTSQTRRTWVGKLIVEAVR
jgi:hypothetical protein